MPIAVACPDCGKQYNVDDRAAGRKVKCRDCGNVFSVAAPAAAGAAGVGARSSAAPVAAARPAADPDDPFATMQALMELGESAAGAESPAAAAAAPPPVPKAKAPLRTAEVFAPAPALPVSHAARGGAVAVAPTMGYGTRARPRRTSTVGVDSATPWLILLLILAHIGAAITITIQYAQLDESVQQAIRDRLMPNFIGAVWTTIIVSLVLFFAIVGPLVFLGIFVGSKIMRFPLPDTPYLKGCGVAAVPGVILASMQILPPNVVLRVMLFVVIVPLAFYVLYYAFDMTFGEAAVSFAFSGIFYVIGQVIAFMIVGMVFAGFLVSGADRGRGFSPWALGRIGSVSPAPTPNRPQYAFPQQSPSYPATPPPPPMTPDEREEQKIASLRKRVESLSGPRLVNRSREELTGEFDGLRREADTLKTANAERPSWQEVDRMLGDLQKQIAAAPSAKPGEEIFQDPSPTEEWKASQSADALGEEVSYLQFKLRPPKDAVLDLQSSEKAPKGLTWRAASNSWSRMSVYSVPRKNERQRRPWAATHTFMLAQAKGENLFALDATDAAEVTEGEINGIAFTRVESSPDPDKPRSERTVKYAGFAGGRWLVVEIVAPQDAAQALERFDTAARTIRHAAGEPKADPFAPERIAARLTNIHDRDRAVEALKAQGAKAEAAVIPYLKHDGAWVGETAAAVLAEIGTEKSVPALTAAANSANRGLSKAAKDALRRIAPDKLDAITDSLMEVKSGDHFRVIAGLQALAGQTPDPKRREEVMAVLMEQFAGDRLWHLREHLGKAMGTWADAKVAPKMVVYLGDSREYNYQRPIAIEVLGQLKYKPAATLIVQRLDDETKEATAALINMGPPAEDAVIPLLREPAPKAREIGANILSEIGTRKSLAALSRASKDSRAGRGQNAASAAAAAKVALEAVRARVAEQGAAPAK